MAKPLTPRPQAEAYAIVDEAHAAASTAPKPAIGDMIEELEAEVSRRLFSARAYTRTGYDVTGDEWRHRLAILLAVVRLLKFVQANEREIARAVKK